jgi:hypothetical protein
MASKSTALVEICIGLLLSIIGFVLWRWSKQILWILVYPPPQVKQLIEGLPVVFWGLSILLVIDRARRKIKDIRVPKDNLE